VILVRCIDVMFWEHAHPYTMARNLPYLISIARGYVRLAVEKRIE